jgi:3-oxoadipate enol-lactonase
VIRHPTLIATDMLYELAAGPRPPATLAALAALASHDIADELEEIAAPALVIHGRDDIILPCSASERLASLLPTAELEIFEDTGHLPMIERPKRFNDAVERFVERLE